MAKEWWEGDGRGEHLIDIALPHEDHEEPMDPTFVPGPTATLATIACVGACLAAVVSVIIATALDLF